VVGAWQEVVEEEEAEEIGLIVSTVVVVEREVVLEWVQPCGAQDMVPRPTSRVLTALSVMFPELAEYPELDLVG
jgi:hypothetical protein